MTRVHPQFLMNGFKKAVEKQDFGEFNKELTNGMNYWTNLFNTEVGALDPDEAPLIMQMELRRWKAMKNVEDMKNINFMVERLTEDAGKAFSPARHNLKSRNDAIISPYKTYELFFEITFMVIQKLGAYEEIGTPEECLEAMQTARACQAQCLDNINDPLEPLKISSALKSELLKLQFRKAEKPESISPLDYTVIAALKEALEKRVQSNDR